MTGLTPWPSTPPLAKSMSQVKHSPLTSRVQRVAPCQAPSAAHAPTWGVSVACSIPSPRQPTWAEAENFKIDVALIVQGRFSDTE